MEIDIWLPRIREVLRKLHGEETANRIKPDAVQPLGNGANPVYQVKITKLTHSRKRQRDASPSRAATFTHISHLVVKFYTHLDGGTVAWASESAALQEVRSQNLKWNGEGKKLEAPDYLTEGLLRSEVESSSWTWPYIVMESLDGAQDGRLQPLGAVASTLNPESWTNLITWLAHQLRQIHSSLP
ncbi:hypothetical protein HK097_006532, partial [Rhizophlyctis rosea]